MIRISVVTLAFVAMMSSAWAQSVKSVKAVPKAAACKACEGKPKVAGKHDPCAVPMTLTLAGLHCDGCASSVTKHLMAVKGVEEATVSAKAQRAVVWVCPSEKVKPAALTAAVVKAGYKVMKVSSGEPKTVKPVKS